MAILYTQRVYNACIYYVDADPTQDGLVAGLNSVAILQNTGETWVKTGLGDDQWTSVVAGAGPASPWIQNGTSIYFDSGNVGIGLTDPQYPLDVDGEANFNGHQIIGVSVPENPDDSNVVTVGYADAHYANQNLSNLLAPTAVNVDLLPSTDNAVNLGSSEKNYLNAYVSNINSPGTLSITPALGYGFNISSNGISTISSASLALYVSAFNIHGTTDFFNNKVVNVPDPTDAYDAMNLHYADAHYLQVSGANKMNADLDMGGNDTNHKVVNVADPTNPYDAMNLHFADDKYLSQTDAASTYLTQANAASTYETQSAAAATFVRIDGASEMTGSLKMGHTSIQNIALAPLYEGHAVAVAGGSYPGASGNDLTITIVYDETITNPFKATFDAPNAVIQYNDVNLTLQNLADFSIEIGNPLNGVMAIFVNPTYSEQLISEQILVQFSGGSNGGTVTNFVEFVTDPVNPQDAMTLHYADNHYVSQSSAPSTYANVSLSNLAGTAINTNLNPATGYSVSLGSTNLEYSYMHSFNVVTSSIDNMLPNTPILINCPVNMGGNHKITGLLGGSDPLDAVNYSQLTSGLAGLIWQNPILDPDVQNIDLNDPPASPVYSCTYIIGGAPTGAWAGYPGHCVWWDGDNWVDDSTGLALGAQPGSAVQVGDRFGVAFSHYDPASFGGGLTQYDIIVITGATPGAMTFDSEAPVNNWAVSVINENSQHSGASYTYSTSLAEWVQFSGPSKVIPGVALSYDGNTLNVNIDDVSVGVNGSNALEVKAGSLTNSYINASAAIDYSKLASLASTAGNVLIADVSGNVITASSIASADLLLRDGSVDITGNLKPSSDNAIDFGQSSRRFATVYATAIKSGSSDLLLASDIGNKILLNNTLDAQNHVLTNVNTLQVRENALSTVYTNIDQGKVLVYGDGSNSIFNNSSLQLENNSQIYFPLGVGGSIYRVNSITSGLTNSPSIDVANRQLLGGVGGGEVRLDWSGTDISVNSRKVTNVTTCTADTDAANKKYVDDSVADATLVAGNGIQIAPLNHVISAVADPAGAIAVSSSGIATKVDNSTIDISISDQLEVKAGGITNTQVSASANIDFFKLAKPPVQLYALSHTASATSDYKILLDCTVTQTLTLPVGTNGLSFIISGIGSGTKKWTLAASLGNTLDANVPTLIAHGNVINLTFLSGVWYLA